MNPSISIAVSLHRFSRPPRNGEPRNTSKEKSLASQNHLPTSRNGVHCCIFSSELIPFPYQTRPRETKRDKSMLSHPPFRAPAIHSLPWSLLLLSLTLGNFLPHLQAQLPGSSPIKPSAAIPAAQPTSSAPSPSSQQQPSRPQRRSQVTLDHGLLTITATNASLNGLVREIARQTGMKVTGSVAEDRVFGTYGPDDPQRVLAILLQGTGTNILIRSSAADAPLQLILTPRTGAATPPNPNANLAENDDDDPTPPPGTPTVVSAPRNRPAGGTPNPPPAPDTNASAPQNQISPASQTVVFPPIDSTSAPATATTTPPDASTPADPSADTVKTPQQIFEQLQRLRQQSTGATTPQ